MTKHVKGEIAETPFGRIHQLDQSLGATVGCHNQGHPNWGTKIPLKTQIPVKATGPTKAHGLLPNLEERKGLKEAQHVDHSHPSQARRTISASLEGSGSTLERIAHLRLARG